MRSGDSPSEVRMSLLQLSRRCPHCSELKDFVISQASERIQRKLDHDLPPLWTEIAAADRRTVHIGNRRVQQAAEICALSRCPHCMNPVMFVVLVTDEDLAHRLQRQHQQGHIHERIDPSAFRVVASYPELPRIDAHPSWPIEIKPFVELQEDVARKRTPAFIISGCRSILDVATKDLMKKYKIADEESVPAKDKSNIFDRVEYLRKRGLLTGALGDWSHSLRKLGANATHDLTGTADDAQQFVEFLKLFLHVAYELPEAIKAKRPTEELVDDRGPV